jgi:hypothetical protein
LVSVIVKTLPAGRQVCTLVHLALASKNFISAGFSSNKLKDNLQYTLYNLLFFVRNSFLVSKTCLPAGRPMVLKSIVV